LVLVALVAVGAAAFLYNKHLNFEIEKEHRIAQVVLYERQRQCAADGKKWAEEYLREEASGALNHRLAVWDNPGFHYSVERSTCLVRTRSVDVQASETYQHARITDLSSNRAVLESYVTLSPDPERRGSLTERTWSDEIVPDNLSRAEFLKRADALMTK
jgi:hypothetical protein